MATVTATADNFQDLVSGNDTVLIDFWASWCGPCRMFAPVYEQAAEKHPDVVFAKVDTEAETDLAAAFQIMSIPTLMIVREGVVVYSQAGALPAPALEQLIEQALALDMAEVHRLADATTAPAE